MLVDFVSPFGGLFEILVEFVSPSHPPVPSNLVKQSPRVDSHCDREQVSRQSYRTVQSQSPGTAVTSKQPEPEPEPEPSNMDSSSSDTDPE